MTTQQWTWREIWKPLLLIAVILVGGYLWNRTTDAGKRVDTLQTNVVASALAGCQRNVVSRQIFRDVVIKTYASDSVDQADKLQQIPPLRCDPKTGQTMR